MMIAIVLLVIWTASSVVWFITGLGRKTEPNRWYDYILCPPAMVIAVIFGWFAKRSRERNK